MDPAPESIDGMRVVSYTPIDGRHRFTGNTKHFVKSEQMAAMAGLAICQAKGEGAFYLFYCDADWKCVTDTWHQTVDDAKQQGEFEYEGTSETWVEASG